METSLLEILAERQDSTPYCSNNRPNFTAIGDRAYILNFAVKAPGRTSMTGLSYKDSSPGWQRFSGKGTGIRAIKRLKATYGLYSP
jgi:hypothetical protein